MRAHFVFVLIVILASCSEKKSTLFTKLSSNKTGITFSNSIKSSDAFNIFSYRNFYNGGGVAIGDINNDELPDIYLISNMESNKLYLNKGNMEFEDITEKANAGGKKAWSTGVVMIDINNDGLLDIYICNAGYLPEISDQENELLINNGNLTFSDKASEYGLNQNGYTTHAAFFDYDLDGDLDAYILNNSFMPVNTLNYSNQRELNAEDWPVKDFLKGGGDKLLRNDNGKFIDVTREAGIFSSLIGFGLGVSVSDMNGDHFPDLYISNDFFERDYLYINQGDGTFQEEIEERMAHISLASMGADIADINNDGCPEIFVSEMLPDEEKRLKTEVLFENYPNYYLKLSRGFYHQYMHNTLQFNNGDESFSEIAWFSGVASSDWSWGALLLDIDNDGFRDIYVCNGTLQDVTNQDFISFFADEVVQKMAMTGEKEEIEFVMNRMPSNMQNNRLFHNNKDLTFTESGQQYGFLTESFSNGAAYGDLDNDGDLDLIINNLNQEAFLYENNTESVRKNHFISIKLKGSHENTFAIGSKVYVYADTSIYNTYIMPSRGFQSSVDYKVTLGIGKTSAIDSLVVIWPDKNKTAIKGPKIDTTYVLEYTNSFPANYTNNYQLVFGDELVTEISTDFLAHQEDNYIDFLHEGLIIKMLSREGPAGDAGDVNGDSKIDIFLGGASGQAAQLYLKTDQGFIRAPIDAFNSDAYYEDTYARFFDADQDGDLDLFVGSGGNHRSDNSTIFQDRIYFNDGTGKFEKKDGCLPNKSLNTSITIPFDIDKDGDLDLFVGSRSIPMNYGLSPQSFIYENIGNGNFKDATLYFAPFLKNIGMITDAKYENILGDEENELILVGEWMTPVILQLINGKFEQTESDLSNYSGWWYAVESNDLDGDGDVDLVLGNRGENFYFTATSDEPAKLWVSDFDNNGYSEKIITRSIDGRDLTLALKKELTEQVSNLYNQNLTHAEFAEKSIQELFTKEQLENSYKREAKWFKSVVAINNGNGKFEIKVLPREVQFSSVNAILCKDVDKDGKNDLILGGNDFGFMPQYSRLDASYGHILINKGAGEFKNANNKKSGLFIKGEIRNFIELIDGGKDRFLVLINNNKPKMYEFAIKKEVK